MKPEVLHCQRCRWVGVGAEVCPACGASLQRLQQKGLDNLYREYRLLPKLGYRPAAGWRAGERQARRDMLEALFERLALSEKPSPASAEDGSLALEEEYLGLVTLVQQIVAEFGDSEHSKDFDAGLWLEGWMLRPQASLGMRAPSLLLDEPDGIKQVATLLRRLAVDAFA